MFTTRKLPSFGSSTYWISHHSAKTAGLKQGEGGRTTRELSSLGTSAYCIPHGTAKTDELKQGEGRRVYYPRVNHRLVASRTGCHTIQPKLTGFKQREGRRI